MLGSAYYPNAPDQQRHRPVRPGAHQSGGLLRRRRRPGRALQQTGRRLSDSAWRRAPETLTLAPEPLRPESYYDLAAFQAMSGKTNNALDNLRVALVLSAKRLQSDPKSSDLAASNRTDLRFAALRSLPEYQKLLPPK